ncbi:MAG: hypothetical protein J5765_01755 [Clostridia bacterium]|nr:hypothetical protein [Clostridia bacterium]
MNLGTIFAGICAIFSSAFVGLWIKKKLLRKASFYEGYYDYLLFATDKIGYERMPIGELNANYFKRRTGEFVAFLKGEIISIPLKEGELTEVRSYLDSIGTTDAETQIGSLSAKCAEMKRFTETECVKYRKDASLYFKLSALIGLAALILLA